MATQPIQENVGIIGIIPARGGSKSNSRKKIKKLCTKTIILYHKQKATKKKTKKQI